MHTAELDSEVWRTFHYLTPRCASHQGAFKKFEYIDKIKTEFDNTSACLSGAQMGLNNEKKTGGRKSRDTLALTKYGLYWQS